MLLFFRAVKWLCFITGSCFGKYEHLQQRVVYNSNSTKFVPLQKSATIGEIREAAAPQRYLYINDGCACSLFWIFAIGLLCSVVLNKMSVSASVLHHVLRFRSNFERNVLHSDHRDGCS